ncbi:transposase [Bradyrhizobium liaoningense]
MYRLIMAIRPDALPTDPASLTEMVLALDAENEKLRVAMQTLREMIFGKRSERLAVLVDEQLALELDDLQTDATRPAPANDDAPAAKSPDRPRRRARRNIGALPKHLPRCEQVLEPEATACPCCQGQLHKIGEDVSEVLDVIPAMLQVLRTVRPKYACRSCTDGVVQAKVLPRLIESGMASTALVSHVVVSKFAWYLPLYRQVQILAGQGIQLDRATLAGWIKRAAWWLKSLYELQLRMIQAAQRVFCDETPMPVLDPGRHRTRICQFWAHAMDDRPWGGPSPPAVAYVFANGRGTEEIAGQLMGFSGILQVDGYAAYKALARHHGGAIQLAFCLAHARRKFVEVYKTTQSPFATRGNRTPAGSLCYRSGDPWQDRTPHQERTVDGGTQGAIDRDGGPALLTVEAGRSDQLCAQSLGRVDTVPPRRPCRGRQQYSRAFHAPDCHGKTQFIVQWQRRRRRELGDPGFAREHGKTP